MNTFLWSLSAFWAVIYGLRICISRASSQSLLPTAARHSKTFKGKALQLNVKNFHLEIRTTALNISHDSLIEAFERPSNRLARLVARKFYDVGVIFGVLGFIIGLAALAYTSAHLLSPIFASNHAASEKSLGKRSVEIIEMDKESHFAISPIIPGVTVPWSHLPFILIALFFSQCFHEAGHALAASVEALPLHAVGASLTLALPSAFVSFSSLMDTLPTAARLRVIASGAWHNLLLWGLIYLVRFTKVSFIWNTLGWKDVRELGLVVLDVEENSPLAQHLQSGNIITTLDDLALGIEKTSPEDIWSQYLLGSKTFLEEGWCIDVNAFFNQPSSCCDSNATTLPSHPPAVQLSCFTPTQNGDQGHCIDPVPILVSLPHERCFSALDCNEHVSDRSTVKECVRPDESAQLMRITVSPPIWQIDGEKRRENPGGATVLWSGPREEVWEQVKVGTIASRHRILPLWLPSATSTCLDYLSTLSLSLFIFNLFALPFLDGSFFLSAMLDYIGAMAEHPSYESEGEPDIELGVKLVSSQPRTVTSGHFANSPTHRLYGWRMRWRRQVRRQKAGIERAFKGVTIALMCTTVIGMAYSA